MADRTDIGKKRRRPYLQYLSDSSNKKCPQTTQHRGKNSISNNMSTEIAQSAETASEEPQLESNEVRAFGRTKESDADVDGLCSAMDLNSEENNTVFRAEELHCEEPALFIDSSHAYFQINIDPEEQSSALWPNECTLHDNGLPVEEFEEVEDELNEPEFGVNRDQSLYAGCG